MIYVEDIKQTMETTPLGMFKSAACFGLYPKFLIRMEEYVYDS
jgi:hypothetical protein